MKKLLLKTAMVICAALLGFTLQAQNYEFVDLGLSVKWATCNLGATSPEAYGNYYAWGETEPKDEYTQENYKWSEIRADGTVRYIKYMTTFYVPENETAGFRGDYRSELDPEDDAVTAAMGLPYRMPRMVECKELIDNCIIADTVINDLQCIKFTGPNGNYIVFPKSGFYWGSDFEEEDSEGYLWTTSLDFQGHVAGTEWQANALYMPYSEDCWSGDHERRFFGINVRAVCPNEPEAVDLGLSVKWASCNLGAGMPVDVGYYYAWGETTPKTYSTWENYKFGDEDNQSKYNNEDWNLQLDPEDDAATQTLGGKWRMPSRDDFDELLANCTIERVKLSLNCRPTNALKVTGPNQNVIYLPMGGCMAGTNGSPNDVGGHTGFTDEDSYESGRYWVKDVTLWIGGGGVAHDGWFMSEDNAYSFTCASRYDMDLDEMTNECPPRYWQLNIRPVWDDTYSPVQHVTQTEDAIVDVYNLQGMLLRHGVNRTDATNGLPRGIYIVGGKKVVK